MIFITDRKDSKSEIARRFEFFVNFDVLNLGDEYDGTIVPTVIIADLNLEVRSEINEIKETIQSIRAENTELFFILRRDTNREIHQAVSLGANGYFCSTASLEKIHAVTKFLDVKQCAAPPSDADLAAGVDAIGATLQRVDASVKSGATIEQKAISDAANRLRHLSGEHRIESLMKHILQFHNPTFRHSLLVSGLCAVLSARAGYSDEECQIITEGALVHDIGKSLIPLWILDKPGALTNDERALIREHPVFGYDYLKRRGALSDDILEIVRGHHELLDGSGYPDQLRGDEISHRLRIATICDIYAALIEPRPYKVSHPPMLAFAMLKGMMGKLDQELLAIFREVVVSYEGGPH